MRRESDLDEFAESQDVLAAAVKLFDYPAPAMDGAPHIEQLRAYDRTVAAWAAGEAVEVTYCAHWEGVSAALSTAVDNTISCTALM